MSRRPVSPLRLRRRSVATLLALLLLAGLAAAPLAASDTPAADRELTRRLDRIFADTYPADGPGAAVLVTRAGEVVLRKGYGMANLELGVPIAPEMVFRLGSITKQFTAASILLLVQDGKLALDQTLGEVLPDYDGPAARVTIEQLLTHTAGVPSYTDAPDYATGMRQDLTVDQMIDRFRDKPLEFEPGTDWHYSNSGYFLLGAVVERVSGMTYEDFVERRVLEPLGLFRTRYGHVAELVPGRVEGYQASPDGGFENADYLSMTQPYAAGSLLSTVDDLARWAGVLSSDRLLRADLRRRMETPATLADGRSTGYGFGLAIHEYQGHTIIEHGGGINGFLTALLWVPDSQVVVVVLSNNMAARPAPTTLAVRAATEALGVPLAERPSIEPDPATLDDYVGVFTIDGTASAEGGEQTRVVTREGTQLVTQRSGAEKMPVRFSAVDRIFYPDSLTTGRFERGPDGAVTGLWITPSIGPEEHATKTDRPLPAERQTVEVDPAVLDAYVGRYQLGPGFFVEITRDGDQLNAQATGQPRFPIFPESRTRFFLKVVDAVIEFRGAEDGTADSLVLYQGGQEIPGQRVD